ncbi:gliding motility-associated C-terminal domain-containing protein [Muriicola jejuensis]|uniref:Gliding motility-associated C-terminal domain-containing protein n=1 Tax=Muriicola jejuensis TaxID=504488 RepID=A0A6P0U826_9FLAO|nr:gliding motility-associated C-terminal domain-containing protein [Muriicola jejuensis]NER09287.1 gliding motility-associated C-terminal domain-containing protein [Muriicola jejuensis]SMP09764.1 gliding motility-associated C-terminal domain-containing protein [Muriicola jejuensis]
MKYTVYIFIFIFSIASFGQTALYNSGNLRIHEEGKIGFHTDLINDGPFDENSGLAGFYGSEPITVSGALTPVLFDVEIFNNSGVLLNTSLAITNNTDFFLGDFISPRNNPSISYSYLQNAFSTGASDNSKVDGYTSLSGQQNFAFPVGDGEQLRPLILDSNWVNSMALCAYFFEDPNNPSTFPGFNTEIKPRDIFGVSNIEFWRLEGSVLSRVTLSWNARSNLAGLTSDVNSITVMGWSKASSQWVNLGRESLAGDLAEGIVRSAPFIPDDYEILTFGSADEPEELLALEDYYLSPNGDGINDFLEIPELELSPNNRLEIYDRRGLKVFQMDNYRDEFRGISNVDNMVLNRNIGLPEGLYFYIISLDDLGLNFQGFLFLER